MSTNSKTLRNILIALAVIACIVLIVKFGTQKTDTVAPGAESSKTESITAESTAVESTAVESTSTEGNR